MKKILLLTGAALFFAAGVHAQGPSIIPKAGLTISKMAVKDDEGMKSKLGFTLGVGLNMPLGEGPISIQPELNFIQKGLKGESTEAGVATEITETINYLEIPFLVKATFGEATKFYVNAGPSVGFGLGGKYKYKGSIGGVSGEVDGKIKFGDGEEDDVAYYDNSTDIGLQLGAGVVIAEKIVIDLRYGLGMTSLMDTPDGEDKEDYMMKNRVFQFTVGIPLSLGN
jgi:hypothetical protein